MESILPKDLKETITAVVVDHASENSDATAIVETIDGVILNYIKIKASNFATDLGSSLGNTIANKLLSFFKKEKTNEQ